jgi:hypothetical protein
LEDLLAKRERYGSLLTKIQDKDILEEANNLAWRALALSQELHERFGAPLAPGAKTGPKSKDLDRPLPKGIELKSEENINAPVRINKGD